jgi:hypothetical protein
MKILKHDETNTVPYVELTGWEVYALAAIIRAGLEGRPADPATIIQFAQAYWIDLHKIESTWKPDYHMPPPSNLNENYKVPC